MQVYENFCNLYEKMILNLYHRGQDPNDKMVPASFVWKHPSEIPSKNVMGMDEMGYDHNKKRRKKVGHVDTVYDALRHAMEVTDGDNNPYHVTVCLTTCADGICRVPPLLGHSNPGSKSKRDVQNITRR